MYENKLTIQTRIVLAGFPSLENNNPTRKMPIHR